MNVIVYSSDDKEKMEILSIKVAEIYAAAILNTIDKLKCSKQQKLKLLDEIRACKENNLY